ncbi:MAG TPA: hypothetical protein VNV44_02170 [Solirubrobacteraceae bacterium]|jgi:hypothetical protein|nr:hypothetical protein [Solirubrobacteraceae bacterium]
MATQHTSGPPPPELDQRARLERRAAARREQRRRRIATAAVLGALAAAAILIVVIASPGSPGAGHSSSPGKGAARAIVPGGPLAPVSVGGLAALWAPQNVVGHSSGTDAAYRAASARSGLPGDLMIADRGNNRILIVEPSGHALFRFPGPGGRGHLFFDDDTFIEPGGEWIISNEEDDNAIVAISLRGQGMKLLFGHPGERGADSTHVNEPDDAYMLPDGTFTVADASNCRILFIREGRIVRRYGSPLECRHDPPHHFTSVNGDTPLPNGGVLVSEIQGSWIDEIGPEGRLLWARKAPVGYPSDPQPLPGGRILLADYSNPGHILIMGRGGRVLWRYGPAAGFGRLDHPSLAMALPNGDVAVNDDYRHRVLVIDPRTNRIVWKYGHTDLPGTAYGHLNTPDGMDFVPVNPNGTPDYAAVVHP